MGDGSGCSWRHVATTSKVAAACVYDKIDAAVVKMGEPCFAKCPQKPDGDLDTASPCYLQCYSRTVYAATQQQITEPWIAAFAGGCPQV